MVRELRELSLTVARSSAAIEMPDVVGARDELVRRYVKAVAVSPPPSPPTRPLTPMGDVEDLPVYWC